MKKLLLLLLLTFFLMSCANKMVITKSPSEEAKKIDSMNHLIDFQRISHSIPEGTLIESVQGGAFCEVQQGWAVGGVDGYSRGPGVPLHYTQAEYSAVGVTGKTDMNVLSLKIIEDNLKKNNIKLSRTADLKLSALIIDIKMNTCLQPYTWNQKSEVSFTINWKIYSKLLKKDLFESDISSYAEETEFLENGVEKALTNVYSTNVNKLINNIEFRKLINSNNLYINNESL